MKELETSKDVSKNGVGDEHFYGYSYGGSRDRIDSTNVKPEELQPLNPPESETKEEVKGENNVIMENSKRNNNNDGRDKDSGIEKIKEKEKLCEDFEEILDLVGSEGKFQKILLYGVLCPIVTVSPFLALNMVFLWDIPDHWCHVPGKDPNMSIEQWKNLTLPWEKGPDGLQRLSQCKMYDLDTGNETKCQFGWEYDRTDYENTIPSEFDWVCDRDYYATDCFTWGSIGSAIGTVIFGILADKYGRKPVFFLACFTNLFFKTAGLFVAKHYMLYKTLTLLGGLAFPALFSMPALISAEVSGTTYRSWIYAVTWMIWVVGNSLMPFVAMVCRGWFLFGIVAAIPGFLLFFYYPIVHESPRWLITAGKAEPAIRILLRIGKLNGKHLNPDHIDRMVHELVQKTQNEAKNQNVGVWTLFSKYRLAKNTIMLTTAWTMNCLLYYGVTLNSTHMAGNRFLNYFFLSLIELPGGWLAGKLVEKTGRRWTQAAFFLLCTISCLVCAVAVSFPNSSITVIIAALGIKFGVTITSLVVYLQGTEIFPTQLRSTGSGLASTTASCVGIFGPYIVYSGTVHVSLPYAMLFLCSILGLVSCSCLPETFKQHLPETIEDANKFGKGHKFWSYLPQALDKTKGSTTVVVSNEDNKGATHHKRLSTTKT